MRRVTAAWLSSGVMWNTPLSMPAIQPPFAARAMQPAISGKSQLVCLSLTQAQRFMLRPSMSAQYKACSLTCHTGLSPTALRASKTSSACMEVSGGFEGAHLHERAALINLRGVVLGQGLLVFDLRAKRFGAVL